jgi:hypothetical protein
MNKRMNRIVGIKVGLTAPALLIILLLTVLPISSSSIVVLVLSSAKVYAFNFARDYCISDVSFVIYLHYFYTCFEHEFALGEGSGDSVGIFL